MLVLLRQSLNLLVPIGGSQIVANYSDIFPLTGGATSIAGFDWSEKTTDFIAAANKAYYCDTALGNILMTLPSSPANGDEVAFLLIGANNLRITTTDKVKGSLLVTDYVKQASVNYLLVILEYVDSTTGWSWHSRYDSYVTDQFVGLTDPYLSNVSLFVKFEGSEGSTTFVDSSPSPKSISNFSNIVTVNTTNFKTGSSSGSFATNNSQLLINNSQLGGLAGDFTVECWYFYTGSGYREFFSFHNGSWLGGPVFNGGLLSFSSLSGAHASNQWQHFAISRTNNVLKMFIDGILVGTVSNSTNYTSIDFYIGRGGSGSANTFRGLIDSFRVTRAGRYTANFNPEVGNFL